MMSNVRLCASLVDQPPNIFHISDYIRMIESWAHSQPAVQCTVFRGQELVKRGLNGIWNVGKAEEAPAMITRSSPLKTTMTALNTSLVGKASSMIQADCH